MAEEYLALLIFFIQKRPRRRTAVSGTSHLCLVLVNFNPAALTSRLDVTSWTPVSMALGIPRVLGVVGPAHVVPPIGGLDVAQIKSGDELTLVGRRRPDDLDGWHTGITVRHGHDDAVSYAGEQVSAGRDNQ